MLDVRRMRVLREVAAQRSFSAAAEKLGYTQSAVSQQIAALEREAGATLIERNPRGIRLTDAGEALVRHADKILARLAEAEAELDAIAGLKGGRLRLASFPTAGATLVPAAVAGERKPFLSVAARIWRAGGFALTARITMSGRSPTSPRPGISATPTPAATRPWTTWKSSLSKICRGSKPAAAHVAWRWRVHAQTWVPAIHGSAARSWNRIRCRRASGWSGASTR